jgi:glycosyltransferase involved in cell wall biosynthesis
LFADVRLVPLPWWNTNPELGLARRAAMALSRRGHGLSLTRSNRELLQAIRDWKINLVHSGTALTLSGATAARQAGVPHLWHIKESVGRTRRVRFSMSDAELVSFMSGHSAFVVAMSEFVGGVFRENRCPNLEILPDGVDTRPYAAGSSRNLREQLKLTPGDSLVGMVASLASTWKEHAVFIRMAAHLARQESQARFIIIGPQPKPNRWPYDLNYRYFQSLRELAQQCDVNGRLQFLDFVPDPPDIMRSLDVLVHTCSEEPFGRIAIEAMAAGTPVVGPRTGGIAESVVDGQTGLLAEPKDAESFAKATSQLLRDPALRQTLGQAGQRRVRDAYSLAVHVEKQTSLYERALR